MAVAVLRRADGGPAAPLAGARRTCRVRRGSRELLRWLPGRPMRIRVTCSGACRVMKEGCSGVTYLAAAIASVALAALIARETKRVGAERVASFTSAFAVLGAAAYVKGVIRGYPGAETTALMMALAYTSAILVTLGRPGLLIFEMDKSLDRSQLTEREKRVVRGSPWLLIAALLACAVPFFER